MPDWITDTGKRCPAHHVLMKIVFDVEKEPVLTDSGRVRIKCPHCPEKDSISISDAKKE